MKCILMKPEKKVPEIYCPEEGKEVPIWFCLGSYAMMRRGCEHLEEATVKLAENFCDVKCKPRSEMDDQDREMEPS